MITYLWTKNDNAGYIGLDGTVYNEAPTAEEIVSLQQYSQRYVNDEEGYRTAFDSNVAPKLGVSNPYAYRQYYNTDDSCLPDICKVNASIVNDGGEPKVEAKIYTADTGCRVLDFVFYNPCGDCMATAGSQNVYVRYTNQDCIDNNGGVYPPRSCMFTEAAGHNVVGFLITDNPEDATDPSKYAWFQVTGSANDAQSYISYVFARSTTKPETPQGGTYETGMPTSPAGVWFDAPHGRNNYPIWMSKRTFWSDEADVIEHANLPWSDPACMSDNKTFQTEWAEETTQTTEVYLKIKTLPSLNESRFQDPSNITEGIDEEAWRAAAAAAGCGNWSDDAEGATYMAWANCRNGVWDDWTVARIRGEAGEDGVNAGRTFMIFASLPEKDENDNDIVPEAPTGGLWDIENNVLLRNANPPLVGIDNMGRSVEWTPDNNTIRGNITWLSVGTFDGEYGRLITPPGWSEPIRITGANGQDGVDGENIEFIFARFEDVEHFTAYYDQATDTKSEECAQMLAAREVEFSKKGTPWEERDYIPYYADWVYEWFDHPQGIGEDENGDFWQVEACCVRQKVQNPENPEDPSDMIWTDWTGPFIWASWGEDGIDGDGVEYIFCVTTKAIPGCKYVKLIEPTSADTEGYVDLDELPETQGNDYTEGFSESDCADPSLAPDVVHLTTDDTYWRKTTIYKFPYNEMLPPQCFWTPDGSEVSGWDHCPDVNVGSLYCTIDEGDPDYDLKKTILYEYYQESEFVPSKERIDEDLQSPDGTLYKILEKHNYSGDTGFITGWDRNWTDNPLDVGPQQPYEWVAIRKYKRGPDEEDDQNKIWRPFSEPKLWANWAFDGTATYTSFVFTRTNDDIRGMVLCGGTFETPYPGATDEYEQDANCFEGLTGGTTAVTYDPIAKVSTAVYNGKPYYWYDTVPDEVPYVYVKLENGIDDVPAEDRDRLPLFRNGTLPSGNDITDDSPEYLEYEESTNPQVFGYYKKSGVQTECIWMSTRIFGDYITGENQGWSSPVRMSDTSDFNVEWCLTDLTQEQITEMKSHRMNFGNFVKKVDDEGIVDDDIHTEAEKLFELSAETAGLGLWSDKGDGAVYMATTTCKNGKWSNWTVSKIKGEKGDAGIGITLYGSTRGVVWHYSELDCLIQNGLVENGDIYCVLDDWQSAHACDCNFDIDCNQGENEFCYQFFQYVGTGDTGDWECIACQVTYTYDITGQGAYDSMKRIDEERGEEGAHTYECVTLDEMPDPSLPDAPLYVYVKGTEEAPIEEYYQRNVRRLVDEGITIVINGVNEQSGDCQSFTAEWLELRGLKNGDFCVWDTDSWRVATNLMGPGTFVHVKYATEHIVLNGKGRYKLTPRDDEHNVGAGETPGRYIGMYVDNNKADFCPENPESDGFYYINDEYYPANEDGGPGPYKWSKIQGDDGLGYEYIYVTSLTDETTNSGTGYVENGRPLVPRFSNDFIASEIYQQDGFVPKREISVYNSTTGVYDNINIEHHYVPARTGATPSETASTYCVDWEDSPVTCDIRNRFRWMCYRMKVDGVWTQFIGDKKTKTEEFKDGLYASFDANYSVDGESVVICDFDNDTLAIGCNEEGITVEELSGMAAIPMVYKGSTSYTVTNCQLTSCTIDNEIIPIADVTGITATTLSTTPKMVTISIAEGVTVVPPVKLNFAVSGESGSETETGTATISVLGIKGSVIYSLLVSKSVIKKDSHGNLIDADEPLRCDVLKRVVGSTELVPADDTDEYYVTFQEDDGVETPFSEDNTYSDPSGDQQDNIEEKVVFRLYTKIDSSITSWTSSNMVLNDIETVYVVSDGEPGETMIMSDLDNELDSIPLTYEGAVDAGEDDFVTATTVISTFYGATQIPFDSVYATTKMSLDENIDRPLTSGWTSVIYTDGQYQRLGKAIDAKLEDNTITFRVASGWTGFTEDPLEIRIYVKAHAAGISGQVTSKLAFTMAGVRAGAPGESAILYSLRPSHSFIAIKQDGTREPDDEEGIYCEVIKKTGTEVEYPIDLAEAGLKIMYTTDDNENSYTNYTQGTRLETAEIDKYITFVLVPNTVSPGPKPQMRDTVDIESIPVVKDGVDGKDAKILVTVDLDNELDSVPLTYDGIVDGGGEDVTASTVISVFYGFSATTFNSVYATTALTSDGQTALNSSGWTSIISTNVQAKLVGSRVIFKIADGWTGFPDDPLEIRIFVKVTVPGEAEEQEYKVTFTLAGVKSGTPGEPATIYSLSPSNSFIAKRNDGNKEPVNVSCTVIKKQGNEVTAITDNSVLASDHKLMVLYTTDEHENNYGRYTLGANVSTTDIEKYLKFVLVTTGTTIGPQPPLTSTYDIESIPVVKDGETGDNGVSILAKCDYWCACPATTTDLTPSKDSIGSSPTGWTMTGEYFEEDDVDFSHKKTASGSIPLPDDTNTHLWKWERYFYSDYNYKDTPISLVTTKGDEVTDIETWYLIAIDNQETTNTVRNLYSQIVSGFTTPLEAHFTRLDDVAPRELTEVNGECEVRWQFQVVKFAQKNPIYLGLEIVERYYKALLDIDVMRGMFGSANVQGKRGAYLREFLGVMGQDSQNPISNVNVTDHIEEEYFANNSVKAFMNASDHWKDDGDLNRGRIMFAAGVKDLGGRYNNVYEAALTGEDILIDIDKFNATTVIWENGRLECTEADISGAIHAYSGSIGGGPDDSGFLKITSSGLTGYDERGATPIQTFKLTQEGAFIGAAGTTGSTVQLTPSGLTGLRSGETVFSVSEQGVYIGASGDTVQLTPQGLTGTSVSGDTIFSVSGSGVKIGASGDTVTLDTVNGLVGSKSGETIFSVNSSGVKIGSSGDTITLDTVNGLVGKQGGDTIFSVDSTGVKIGKSGDTVTLDTANGLVGTKAGETIFSVNSEGVQFKNEGGNVQLTTNGLYGYKTGNNNPVFSLDSNGVSFGGLDGDAILLTTSGLTGFTANRVPIFTLNQSGLSLGATGTTGSTIRLTLEGLYGYKANQRDPVFSLNSNGVTFGGAGDVVQLSTTGLTGYKTVGNQRQQSFYISDGGVGFGTSGDTVQLTTDGLVGRNDDGQFFSIGRNGVDIGGTSGDTIHITRSGISGTTSSGGLLFKLDGNGVVANRGTFNGTINATDGQIGNLRVENGGIRVISSGRTGDVDMETELSVFTSGTFTLYGKSGDANDASAYESIRITNNGMEMHRHNYNGDYLANISRSTIMMSSSGRGGANPSMLEVHDNYLTIEQHYGNLMNLSALSAGSIEFTSTYGNTQTGDTRISANGITTWGTISANGGFFETSDARYKNVGEPLTNVLSKLSSIPTIHYTWKDGHDDNKEHIGTLAQDVLTVFPEVVNSNDDGKYEVDYAKLSIIALAAIKELKNEVDGLKEEITKLKTSD